MCCQMMSESLRGAVFNAFFAKLSVEVELGDPSVIDVLRRTSEMIGVSQIELIEECFLLELLRMYIQCRKIFFET